MIKRILLIFCFTFSIIGSGQNVQNLIDQVDQSSLLNGLNVFSGETSTTVNGNVVTLLNRVSNTDNNLAADYLLQELQSLPNLNVQDNIYSSTGRNIIGTQTGTINPNDIYIICGHYDAVANYCADDNASGTVAILEIARILSQQCVDNTIVYALWDEEELGLIGARNYATAAAARGDNIKAVLNLDMMGFDGDGDNEFDIDVRNIANSIAMKDDIVGLLNTYNSSINLSVNIVNPGTPNSDHKPFWDQNYTAVLLGEAWSNNDQNTAYHTAGDRVSLMDISYYHDMVKICMAYIATKAGVSSNNTNITQSGNALQVDQQGAVYQWIDCNNQNAIVNENRRNFNPTSLGSYAVDVTINGCTERSECFTVDTLNNQNFDMNHIDIYPNPVSDILKIKRSNAQEAVVSIYNVQGKKVLSTNSKKTLNIISIKHLSDGLYFIAVSSRYGKEIRKFLKI
ncbi:MAG: M28 family peptidase [Nonlabens sp.]|uniref:M28 family peptidase n=1 Tax=Nonlabens sp. TaxID=1888209 RepID=UPI0032191662